VYYVCIETQTNTRGGNDEYIYTAPADFTGKHQARAKPRLLVGSALSDSQQITPQFLFFLLNKSRSTTAGRLF